MTKLNGRARNYYCQMLCASHCVCSEGHRTSIIGRARHVLLFWHPSFNTQNQLPIPNVDTHHYVPSADPLMVLGVKLERIGTGHKLGWWPLWAKVACLVTLYKLESVKWWPFVLDLFWSPMKTHPAICIKMSSQSSQLFYMSNIAVSNLPCCAIFFFFQFLEDISTFCGATDTPVLDFW